MFTVFPKQLCLSTKSSYKEGPLLWCMTIL